MARYIDADAIHEKYDRYANHSPFGRNRGKMLAGFLDWIDEEPTADVVEVVRCGECRHLMSDGRCFEFADDNIRPSASDYCSYGERREDGEIH